MSLKLMYITNNPMVALIAEQAGVDRIWIDLEYMGKEERQKGMNTVKSDHKIEDVEKVKPYLKKSELMVRVNPMHKNTKIEIDKVINAGADLIMLPMFRTVSEVKKFVQLINGRAKAMLLLETKEAYENLEEIVKVPGIDEIHIGLNDLHLSYDMTFMFEPLANGMVDQACNIIKPTGIKYGFGGVAKLGEGALPAEYIVGEHYRLGSSMVILSRTFCDTWTDKNEETLKKVFKSGINDLRLYEDFLSKQENDFFEINRNKVERTVEEIVRNIKKREEV